MLRSIADIARSEGERLGTPGAKLACLEVFALGGRSKSDDASESAYFLIRGALAKSISDAAGYMTERGLAEQGAPAIVKFITQLATRFGVNVSQKVAAQAVPVIGAAGGYRPLTRCGAALQPLILRPYQLQIISSFQSADNEVTPCHLLEMVYEQDVDRPCVMAVVLGSGPGASNAWAGGNGGSHGRGGSHGHGWSQKHGGSHKHGWSHRHRGSHGHFGFFIGAPFWPRPYYEERCDNEQETGALLGGVLGAPLRSMRDPSERSQSHDEKVNLFTARQAASLGVEELT